MNHLHHHSDAADTAKLRRHMFLLYIHIAFFSDSYIHISLTSAPLFIIICCHIKQCVHNCRRNIASAFSASCNYIWHTAFNDFFFCLNYICGTGCKGKGRDKKLAEGYDREAGNHQYFRHT